MPYKERVRAGLPRKRDKQKYKVKNWSEYNQSLRQRGMISLYFPAGDLETLFIVPNLGEKPHTCSASF